MAGGLHSRIGITAAALVVLVAAAPVRAQTGGQQAPSWQLRWSPEPAVDGLRAFEAVEEDRADSHPGGQPHITVDGDSYRFTMHTVDRDISRDRQRQEVRGMTSAGRDLILGRGERWRITYSMFIPGSLKATTSFTHIMQTKAPGAGSLPMLTTSLRRQGNTPRIELRATQGNVQIGATDLTPLQNRWIDVELEMTIGDASTGRVRWVLRDGTRTVVDVTRSNVDIWLADRVRLKWGIYRSLGDTSGSLQNCHLLIRNMRAYEWSEVAAPPTSFRPEAENARILQGVVDTNQRGYTGTGFVRPDSAGRLSVEWIVDAAAAGTATLTFAYANGSGADRPVDIAVNGTLVADDFAFIPTPAWHEWDTRTIRAPVKAGTNTIRATVATTGSGPNFDNLGVQMAPPSVGGGPNLDKVTVG